MSILINKIILKIIRNLIKTNFISILLKNLLESDTNKNYKQYSETVSLVLDNNKIKSTKSYKISP